MAEYGSEKTVARLGKRLAAIQDSPYSSWTSFSELRRALRAEPQAATPVPWVNVPAGVQAFAVEDDNLGWGAPLAGDANYIYLGFPWGVKVLDKAGRPLRRLALGPATVLLRTPE